MQRERDGGESEQNYRIQQQNSVWTSSLHGRSGPKDEESRKKRFRNFGMAGTGGSKNRILFDSPGFFFPEERWEIDPGGSGFGKCFETEAGDEADG